MIGRNDKRVSLVHVRDLADGIVLAGESEVSRGRTYFISSEDDYSMRAVADLIAALMRRRPALLRDPPLCGLRGSAGGPKPAQFSCADRQSSIAIKLLTSPKVPGLARSTGQGASLVTTLECRSNKDCAKRLSGTKVRVGCERPKPAAQGRSDREIRIRLVREYSQVRPQTLFSSILLTKLRSPICYS